MHQRKFRQLDNNSTIDSLLRKAAGGEQASKVMAAELMMVQFIATHNIPFQAADHLSELVSSMFPNSQIAAEFRCKHTKTKAINMWCIRSSP